MINKLFLSLLNLICKIPFRIISIVIVSLILGSAGIFFLIDNKGLACIPPLIAFIFSLYLDQEEKFYQKIKSNIKEKINHRQKEKSLHDIFAKMVHECRLEIIQNQILDTDHPNDPVFLRQAIDKISGVRISLNFDYGKEYKHYFVFELPKDTDDKKYKKIISGKILQEVYFNLEGLNSEGVIKIGKNSTTILFGLSADHSFYEPQEGKKLIFNPNKQDFRHLETINCRVINLGEVMFDYYLEGLEYYVDNIIPYFLRAFRDNNLKEIAEEMLATVEYHIK